MKGKTSITINGRQYDAITGMPIASGALAKNSQAKRKLPEVKPVAPVTSAAKPNTPAPKAAPKPAPSSKPVGGLHRAFSDIGPTNKQLKPLKKAIQRPSPTPGAKAVHQKPQKSQTLYRAALKRPAAQMRRSPAISKFGPAQTSPAKTPQTAALPAATASQPELAASQPKQHPIASKALRKIASSKPKAAPQRSSKELKELLIKERMGEVTATAKAPLKNKPGFFRRRGKLTTVLTSTLVILLLGGYLTYINLPNISLRVAATRAGIEANFPNYKPDGYSFHGPITYVPGEVSINFNSNTSKNSFTLKQKSSSWDSQAVLDNFVSKQTQNYLTYQEKGLTIYAFGNKAAWVNGGLLYTIEGNAELSSEQLLKLATSM